MRGWIRVLALLAVVTGGAAMAQPRAAAPAAPVRTDQPAYYQADRAEYDRERGLVTLNGHVQLWQGERMLTADTVTYDRNTGVAAARGHVVLVEPDGQVVFAEYAELSEGMKQGVLAGMSAILAENGRLVANGARRTDGRVNELSRVVYSTCDLCKDDPDKAPLWQIRAREAVQDLDNHMIEYRDAVVDIFGFPVFWTPYLTHPDPSQKRASGLLVPSLGMSKHLGVFAAQPYYWVIDDQSDATITPMLATRQGPALELEYRRRFNSGTVSINGSAANTADGNGGGHLFARGKFAIDDVWRWGVDIERASSLGYMRDFHIQGTTAVLTSQAYLEGFGQGSYVRLDTRAYQGLTSNVTAGKLPFVLPRFEYSLQTQPLVAGGRFDVEAGAFNVLRGNGTNTQRGNFSLGWQREAIGALGEVWKANIRIDTASYVAHQFDEQPNFGRDGTFVGSQAMPTVAIELRWPLMRDAGSWGSQLVEPIAQVVQGARGSNYVSLHVPNEDSFDQEFTDATLFALNRYPGIDRMEGGTRVNVALHGAWFMPGGAMVDAQVGQAFRAQKDPSFLAGTGLENTASDIVSHLTFTPNSYLDVTSRQRFDKTSGRPRFADVLATAGPSMLKVNAGYLYSLTNPFFYYDAAPTSLLATKPRNEVSLGLNTTQGKWSFRASSRRDVGLGKMVSLGLGTTYEDECFIFDVGLSRRYTSINNDHGASMVLFQLTFKSIGQFGFHAF